jgi:hypothetical protein
MNNSKSLTQVNKTPGVNYQLRSNNNVHKALDYEARMSSRPLCSFHSAVYLVTAALNCGELTPKVKDYSSYRKET